ncbi:MAG: hypothetical protein Q8O92_07785 [Candidatus Latescibacter sp.]|nr:hypothetical protein [Candidatus Latescibacter sp.]
MRRLIFIITIFITFFAVIQPGAVGTGKTVLFMPFYDDSGYRGPWLLRYEIPIMLGDMIGDSYYTVVSMDSVRARMEKPRKKSLFFRFINVFMNQKERQRVLSDTEVCSIARQLGADIAVVGTIDDYTYKRIGGGEPFVGGYKYFNAKVVLDQVKILNVATGRQLGKLIHGEDSKSEKGLGLELFGKERRRDYEFYSLDSLDFGSKRFLGTLMGQATVEALNKVNKEIRAVITLPDTNWYSYKKFRVLLIESGVVTINAGSLDGVKPGDRFRVYTSDSGTPVGKINVTTVWSERTSKAEILDGKDEIRVNDVIMPDLGQ